MLTTYTITQKHQGEYLTSLRYAAATGTAEAYKSAVTTLYKATRDVWIHNFSKWQQNI